jgi:hypothetical protein
VIAQLPDVAGSCNAGNSITDNDDMLHKLSKVNDRTHTSCRLIDKPSYQEVFGLLRISPMDNSGSLTRIKPNAFGEMMTLNFLEIKKVFSVLRKISPDRINQFHQTIQLGIAKATVR